MIIGIVLGVLVLIFGLSALTGAPYVPTHANQLKQLFSELYPLSSTDLLIDIGSGDGVVLKAAASHGARAIGYEINPLLVVVSWCRLYRFRRTCRVKLANFWLAHFPPETTVVYTFGESRDIRRMHKKVVQEATRLGKPLYFISYGFSLKDETPLKTVGAHYLYKVAPLQTD